MHVLGHELQWKEKDGHSSAGSRPVQSDSADESIGPPIGLEKKAFVVGSIGRFAWLEWVR
jgi:hypothetical protein